MKVQTHRVGTPPTTVEPELRKHLTRQNEAINGLLDVFNGARPIDSVSCEAGVTKKIAHGLGRRLRGYLITRIDSGDAAAYHLDEQDQHSDTDQFLYLRFEGLSPTISLLVF